MRRCLGKDPRQRLRDIGDARIEIEDVIAEPVGRQLPSAVPRRRTSARLAVAAATGALVSGLVVWALQADRETPIMPVNRFELSQPGLLAGVRFSISVSPSGHRIAYGVE